jgi:hypothetical protein
MVIDKHTHILSWMFVDESFEKDYMVDGHREALVLLPKWGAGRRNDKRSGPISETNTNHRLRYRNNTKKGSASDQRVGGRR